MGMNRNFNSNDNNNNKSPNNRNDQYIDDANEDEYEEGEVNGFMVQRPLPTNGFNSPNPNVCFILLSLTKLFSMKKKTFFLFSLRRTSIHIM